MKLLQLYPDIEFNLEEEESKWFDSVDHLRTMHLVDGEYVVNQAIRDGKKILAEGAQGSMLDIDFGTYPFVTSSNTVTSGVCNGLGISPARINRVYGISKAYCTRVGSGPFPTELDDETGEKLRKLGHEFGATTGRPRRCGWIDLPQLKYTIMINGVTDIVITKLDVLDAFENIKYCNTYKVNGEITDHLPFDLCDSDISALYKNIRGWNSSLDTIETFRDLPQEAQTYIETLESLLETPISMISTGPERRKILKH